MCGVVVFWLFIQIFFSLVVYRFVGIGGLKLDDLLEERKQDIYWVIGLFNCWKIINWRIYYRVINWNYNQQFIRIIYWRIIYIILIGDLLIKGLIGY